MKKIFIALLVAATIGSLFARRPTLRDLDLQESQRRTIEQRIAECREYIEPSKENDLRQLLASGSYTQTQIEEHAAANQKNNLVTCITRR